MEVSNFELQRFELLWICFILFLRKANVVIFCQAREKDASEYQQQVGNKIAETLRKLIAPYFLRRTKAEVFNVNKKQILNDTESCDQQDGEKKEETGR